MNKTFKTMVIAVFFQIIFQNRNQHKHWTHLRGIFFSFITPRNRFHMEINLQKWSTQNRSQKGFTHPMNTTVDGPRYAQITDKTTHKTNKYWIIFNQLKKNVSSPFQKLKRNWGQEKCQIKHKLIKVVLSKIVHCEDHSH